MKFPALFSLLLFSQFTFSQTNPSAGYPTFEVIVKVFFKNYSPPGGLYYFTSFQKKQDGYHVVELDDQLEPQKSHLFWSKKLGGFTLLPFSKPDEQDAMQNSEDFLRYNKYDESQFDLHPYYGYPGWSLDVIEAFEKQDELSDSMLYSLARAYSYRCNELVGHDSRSTGAPGGFGLPAGKNSMTAAQLEIYEKVARKAIENFHKLYLQNPDFQTIVGPVYTKYCHEIMYQYLQLHIYQNEEVAKQILVNDLYDPFTLATARNFLNSCPPNAVLATWGDGDTYPLLYVQAVENFRRDVLVANLSLLQLGRYIQHISEGIYDAEPLPLSLGFDFYNDPDHVAAMIADMGGSTSLDDLMHSLKNHSLNKQPSASKYPYIPTFDYHTSISFDSAGVLVDKRINFQFSTSQRYLLIYDLFFLDLIYSTKGKRPICYAVTCLSNSMDYINKYLALQGLVYLMKTEEVEPDDFGLIGGPDEAALERLLFEVYEYTDLEAFTSDVQVLHQYHFLAFLRLADRKLKQGEKESAVKIADRYFELFPLTKTRFAGVNGFVKIYLSADQPEKARPVWLSLINHWEQDPTALAEDEAAFMQLSKVAEEFDVQELRERLEVLKP